MVRELAGTIRPKRAAMGILITLSPPTKGMLEAAKRSGSYIWPVTGKSFPTLQILTIDELLKGRKPSMPPAYPPYIKAQKYRFEIDDKQGQLFE